MRVMVGGQTAVSCVPQRSRPAKGQSCGGTGQRVAAGRVCLEQFCCSTGGSQRFLCYTETNPLLLFTIAERSVLKRDSSKRAVVQTEVSAGAQRCKQTDKQTDRQTPAVLQLQTPPGSAAPLSGAAPSGWGTAHGMQREFRLKRSGHKNAHQTASPGFISALHSGDDRCRSGSLVVGTRGGSVVGPCRRMPEPRHGAGSKAGTVRAPRIATAAAAPRGSPRLSRALRAQRAPTQAARAAVTSRAPPRLNGGGASAAGPGARGGGRGEARA